MADLEKKRHRDRRNHKVIVRFNDDELFELDARCESVSCTRSDLIRASIMRVKTWTKSDKEASNFRSREIAKIGNNLNQISRWCNTHKDDAESVEVIAHLIAISNKLNELKND